MFGSPTVAELEGEVRADSGDSSGSASTVPDDQSPVT